MPRRRAPITFQILNAYEISEFFVELGRVPQKSVRKAAKAGAIMVKRKVMASNKVPVKQGFLKSSVKEFEEKKVQGKRNVSGKAGFDVGFDRSFNSIFQKEYKGHPRRGSKDPRTGDKAYYYPASMEYGFATSRRDIGGRYFLRDPAKANADAVQDKMIEVLSKDIDKIKQGG